MLIESGSWFMYSGQLYAVLKSFKQEDLLHEAKVSTASELLAYMKQEKIISLQAPVHYVLTDELEFESV